MTCFARRANIELVIPANLWYNEGTRIIAGNTQASGATTGGALVTTNVGQVRLFYYFDHTGE